VAPANSHGYGTLTLFGIASRFDTIFQSLALALYFASRGVGQLRNSHAAPIPFTTAARVLISGLGSDELLGGYGRHRTAFTAGGWQAVIDEVIRTLLRLLPEFTILLAAARIRPPAN
jgi:asparagine synthetase B (glutamine-hydrolysing)